MNGQFPKRLFYWFVKKQLLIAGLGLFVLQILLLVWLESREDLSVEARSIGLTVMWVSMVAAALLVAGVSVFMARRMMGPLGRLIARTRRLHLFPFEETEPIPQDFVFDEPGEWSDLERALNELSVDLQQKTIRLSREKTELRTIMSAINEAVLAIDQERQPLFYNTQFAMVFRILPEGIEEMALAEIIRSPDVLSAYDRCLKTGVVDQVEATLEPTALGPRTYQVSVAPLRKKHNQEIYGAVAVFHDISQMKKAEKMRIDFVGNVSHELRTPLTSIKGYMQTLMQDIEQKRYSDAPEFLKIIDRNVGRLMSLVDDLLDLSALQSGVELKKKNIDVKKLTASVLGQVDTRSHQVNCSYMIETVVGDEYRVEQVLRNLLQNATRYVPPGGKIDVRWAANDHGAIELSVKDNGPGIAAEHLPRLFERFYRVDDSRSRPFGGSGIGLSLVKHIMQRHGGQVRVVSQKGNGAEFICEFPLTLQLRTSKDFDL
jgi:two-component system, OmpR family, phosphate regulon sensor histidine kinase PhoR